MTTSARRSGFEAALAEAGIDAGRSGWSPSVGVTGGAGDGAAAGPRRLPTAVFAESDEMALGALQTLRRAGLDVPGRMSLVGFDDHEMAPAGDLTTIAQPVHQQGELAARLLLDVLEGGDPPPGDVVLPTRLVVRGTTGPPPAWSAGSVFA